VPGTLMVEPTESEPKEELDRFLRRDDRDPR
jgi:glycine cleavage system protein P-like pyridoxal-binding family